MSSNDPLSMVYELLWDCFVLNDFLNGFDFFLNMWAHCSWSCSLIRIAFTYDIIIINFGKVNQWLQPIMIENDLSIGCPHTHH
jgi:hypothetical protein